MVTQEVLTGLRAQELLESVGFVTDRVTDKVYMKRGATRITLPKGDAQVGSQQEIIVRGIVRDLTERQTKAEDYKAPPIPLMVTYRDVVYAVVSDRITKWQLQNLETGQRFEVDKDSCRPYEMPLTELATQLEEAKTPEPTPVEQAPAAVTPLTNNSDLQALIRLTNRRLEGLKVEFAQLQGRAEQLRVQYHATATFLESLGLEVTQLGSLGEIEAPVKRTVLPPTTGPKVKHGGRRTGTDYTEHRRVLREEWKKTNFEKGYGYSHRLKSALEKAGLPLPPSNYIYKLIKEIEEERG